MNGNPGHDVHQLVVGEREEDKDLAIVLIQQIEESCAKVLLLTTLLVAKDLVQVDKETSIRILQEKYRLYFYLVDVIIVRTVSRPKALVFCVSLFCLFVFEDVAFIVCVTFFVLL